MGGGWLNRLRQGLEKTREGFRRGLSAIGGQLDAESLERLEEVLLGADIGVRAATAIVDAARRGRDPMDCIRAELLKRLKPADTGPVGVSPEVVMVVGVNGTGKTTTVARLAHRAREDGRRAVVAAADTFRAAAADQLGIWCDRLGCELVRGREGSDPAAVAFDAAQAAVARRADLLLVDTAGRLHTRKNLMSELEKVGRVLGRVVEGAPHRVLLVIDATTGQNAIQQARLFNDAIPVSGLVLTKFDGTARGGVIVAIADELGLPVACIGVGEGEDDLLTFDPVAFVDALLGEG